MQQRPLHAGETARSAFAMHAYQASAVSLQLPWLTLLLTSDLQAASHLSPVSQGHGALAGVASMHWQHAVPLVPAAFISIYTLLYLGCRYFVPRFIKEKLDILTHDPVTIDDIPDAEPIPRKLPFRKIVLRVCACLARLAIEIYFLVSACLARPHASSHKLEIALYSTNVGLWTLLTIHSAFARKPTPYYGLTLFYLLDMVAVWQNHLTVIHFESPLALYLDLLLRLARLTPSLVLLCISLSLPMSPFLPTPKSATPTSGATREFDSPEDGTTLISWLLVDWMNPLLTLARLKTLDDENVWQLSPYFQHSIIYPAFLKLKPTHYMTKLYAFNAFDILIGSTCSLAGAFLTYSSPYILNKILKVLDPNNSADESQRAAMKSTAYKLAFLALLLNILKSFIEIFKQFHSRRAYERSRGILVTMIFDKATRRKDTSGSIGHRKADKDEEDVAGSNNGNVLNLMNGDAYAVAGWFWEGITSLVKAPIELTVATVFLYQILGWSSIVGLSTIAISYAAAHFLMRRNLALARTLMASTDRRISVISELVSAIRFLKYYAWEKIWVDKAIAAREKELSVRYRSNLNSAFLSLVFLITPSMITFATFWCYTKLAKRELLVPEALSAMLAFQMVQQPLFELPGRVIFYLQTRVSVRRLERFFEEPELEDVTSSSDISEYRDEPVSAKPGNESTSLTFHITTHIYPQQEVRDELLEPFKLRCPDIEFPKGKLTVVYGDNASGKTSLLMACLGEMDCIKGHVSRPTSRHAFAIATQDVWLEQATIRGNITFGMPYDEERFQQVLDACALSFDLAIWEAREHTEIGERGISLSGGQKARLALARAVYSKAPFVLLDDPLSAVDAHTARHLVDNCLAGPLMKDRTCILVTHHIRLCIPIASLLIRMDGGRAELEEVAEKDIEELPDVDNADEETITATPSCKTQATGMHTPANGGLITKEHRDIGSVKWTVYKMYLHAAGLETWFGILSMLLAARGMSIVQTWFLKQWGESYNRHSSSFLPPASENVNAWLGVYVGLTFLTASIYLARLGFSYHGSFKAARALLYACLLRVTSAPSRWLDENPTGRLLNRFTADIGSVDSTMNNSVTEVCNDVIGTLISLGAVLVIVPRFLIFAAVSTALYAFFLTPYVRCSRDLRRLENNHRSPLFSRFGGLLQGLKIVRAFGQEKRYISLLMSDLDLFQSMDHFFWSARSYLSVRLDFVGALAIYSVMLIGLAGGVGQGSAALAIIWTQQFVSSLHAACWSYAKLELDINSIERIHDLLLTPQEAPAIIETKRPPAHWPAYGHIEIEDLAVRYAPHLPLVLKGITVTIKAGEKVGIVGRTGSGKTTLAHSLLRITEPAAGSIIIDGIDMSNIGLRDLRERITIISQDAILFEGTVRSNLDPTKVHSDHELWDVLRRVGMANNDDNEGSSNHYIAKLDAAVTAGAENFSLGERQLLSIARALLRRTKVFIADEATASVDFDTDEMVQHTLRRELYDATVITIAHRLRTVIDVDKVLVMSEGVLTEIGSPRMLLDDPESAFSELCRQSNELDELTRLASLNR